MPLAVGPNMPRFTDDQIDALPATDRLALRLALRAWERPLAVGPNMPRFTDDQIDALPATDRLALRLALRAWERRTLAYAARVTSGYKAHHSVIDTVYSAVDWTDPVMWRDVPTRTSDYVCL